MEYLANGVWQTAQMNGDMGQSFILGGTTSGGNQFQIRVRDVTDTLINNGRVYSFTLPASCGSSCPVAYTPVTYTTSTGPEPDGDREPDRRTRRRPPTPTVTRPDADAHTDARPAARGPARPRTRSPGQWSGGFQAEVAVRNTGSSPLAGWRVSWTFANGQTVTQLWNGTLTTTGASVAVVDAGYNAAVPVNGNTTFGFTASWNNATNAVPVVTCAPR